MLKSLSCRYFFLHNVTTYIILVLFAFLISYRGRRSAFNLVQVLEPLLNQSTIAQDVNSTLLISNPTPNITRINGSTLEIIFGFVQNPPTPRRSYQVLTILLKFKIAALPLVLSGRDLVVVGFVRFTGGQSIVNGLFKVIGPLIKPLLTIRKSVKVTNCFLSVIL